MLRERWLPHTLYTTAALLPTNGTSRIPFMKRNQDPKEEVSHSRMDVSRLSNVVDDSVGMVEAGGWVLCESAGCILVVAIEFLGSLYQRWKHCCLMPNNLFKTATARVLLICVSDYCVCGS